jgi:hypothetical protein
LKLLFFISILFFFLYANNPNVYPTLSSKIYNSLPKIKRLTTYPEFYPLTESIVTYIKDVEETKQMGFAIDSGKSKAKKEYLHKLRKLSKKYDFFKRSAEELLNRSIENKDYDLFVRIVDSGLIDMKRNKEKILTFYKENSISIIPFGKLAEMVQEHTTTPKSQEALQKERLKKQKEKALEQLRENDRKQQFKIQKELEQQLFNEVKK